MSESLHDISAHERLVQQVQELAVPASPTTHIGSNEPCIALIGAFDGVHKGHQELIGQAKKVAQLQELPLLAITFRPDPSSVLGHPEPRILSYEDVVNYLIKAGIDDVRTYEFTQRLSKVSAQTFMDEYLLKNNVIRALYVGDNFRMGHGATLRASSTSVPCEVIELPLKEFEDKPISSTRIRSLVEQGNLEEAHSLLGRPFFVRGCVVHGRGQGRTFGFPTANLEVDEAFVFPCKGVWAGFASFEGKSWPAAINVGRPPTFDAGVEKLTSHFLEATLLGFEGNLYGKELTVAFGPRLRSSHKFSSQVELINAVTINIAQVRTLYGDTPC